jgi:hypothetical protein
MSKSKTARIPYITVNQYDDVYLPSGEYISFQGIRGNGTLTSSTGCKEILGYYCVEGGHDKVLFKLPKFISTDDILKLKQFVNDKEKEVKVRASKFYAVHKHKNQIVVEYSPMWVSNSVAHSLLMTWIRFKVRKLLNLNRSYIDEQHLKESQWLVDILTKRGLRALGTIPHKNYDYGIVQLQRALHKNNFSQAKSRTKQSERKGVRYAPVRRLFAELNSPKGPRAK